MRHCALMLALCLSLNALKPIWRSCFQLLFPPTTDTYCRVFTFPNQNSNSLDSWVTNASTLWPRTPSLPRGRPRGRCGSEDARCSQICVRIPARISPLWALNPLPHPANGKGPASPPRSAAVRLAGSLARRPARVTVRCWFPKKSRYSVRG